MNNCRSCYGEAKARSVGKEQHGEVLVVFSKCMLHRSNVEAAAAMFIRSILLSADPMRRAPCAFTGGGGVEVGNPSSVELTGL